MLVWTVVDPMYFDRTRRCGSDELTSYGSCRLGETSVSVSMAASVGVVNFLAVVLANVQAYKARNIKTDFNESSYVGIAMLSIMQIFLVGTPLVFLVNDSPPAKFFIITAIISVVCFSVLLLAFWCIATPNASSALQSRKKRLRFKRLRNCSKTRSSAPLTP